VAPGFDFEDFEMPPRADLLHLLSEHRDLVMRLTR
jgi:predicted cupin superfamily sugar epimerase